MKKQEVIDHIIEELSYELDTISFYYDVCLNLVKSSINRMSYEELATFIKEKLEPCRNKSTITVKSLFVEEGQVKYMQEKK